MDPDNSQSTTAPKWSDSKTAQGLRGAGSSMSKSGQDQLSSVRSEAAAGADRQQPLNLPSYRKGGKVRKTGVAKLHRGEYVVPAKKVRSLKKMFGRKSGRA
jgi:hypothetical protein